MPVTGAQLDNVFASYPTQNDNERLQLLKIARVQTEAGIALGQAIVTIEIRQRRTQLEEPLKVLEYLNRTISQLEAKVNRKGPARNKAALH